MTAIQLQRKMSLSAERKYSVQTETCGDLTVYVQGDLHQKEKKAIFLTVHDLGCNHTTFHDFVNNPAMAEIKERSVFIHVDMPGHEDNAPNLPETYKFPSLEQLGIELVSVLDHLEVKYVVGLGEGAGANVLARFGLHHPSRTLGLILINCNGSTATFLESIRNKFVSWSGKEQVTHSAEEFLVYHKFGHQICRDTNPDKEFLVQDFLEKIRGTLNYPNIKLYVDAFTNRTDLAMKDSKVDILLITGSTSTDAAAVEKINKEMNKEKVTMLKIDKSGDVMSDSPAKVAQSLLLFCKGQGLLSSVMMPGLENPRRLSRGMSMEEYDKPNIRRLSLSTN